MDFSRRMMSAQMSSFFRAQKWLKLPHLSSLHVFLKMRLLSRYLSFVILPVVAHSPPILALVK